MCAKLCGLLGEKLGHSFSPQIHAHLADYRYDLFPMPIEQVEGFMKNGDWDAINVTIPYKQVVMPYLDVITDEARRIGAVNTITRLPDGRLRGDNTDYFGFHRTLTACGCDPRGKKALVLGNGGAAATAVTVLSDMGAEVILLGKSDRSVGGLAPEGYDTVYDRHADAEIVVNCTPVGMYPKLIGQTLVELARLPHVKAVFDMVYNPARTALLQEAISLGIPAYNGLLMLVAQAKRASELFMGEDLPDGCIDEIVASISRETGNIILIGMPGCGKSTLGRKLAEALNRPFVDTDSLIEEAAGRPIPEIFATDGEEVFRAYETDAVKRAGMMSGAVIATGGGVVTRERNYAPLSQNGSIVFIKRDLSKLPTKGRPLSQANPLEVMYARRLPLYRRFADMEISNNGPLDQTVARILSELGYQ